MTWTARARMQPTVVSALAAVALACLLAVVPAAAASAHDYLVQSTPSAGSTQSTPLKSASLTFNDRVLDLSGDGSSSLVQVTDAANRHYETGCPTITDRMVTAPVALGAPGAYTVTWQIVSADGHTVSGTIPFTYQPPAGTAEAPGSDGPPACAAGAAKADGQSTGAATSSPAPAAAANGASGSGSIALVIAIGVGIVVLALIGVLVVVLTGRRRPAQPKADDAS
ncbi:copper resistance protein CopC [Leifsonia sp. NPDC014704]|uniref:copper resistance CopC family protein n=1 Tax=Leifsonia sp. NPDC014704 TaxID=3364123 RepID=UPI0036F48B07